MHFTMTPRGPFTLDTVNDYFGGWMPFAPDPSAVVMAFPMEGWEASAAVVLTQGDDPSVNGQVHLGADQKAGESRAEQAWQQALAVVSLDCDGTAWPQVGRRDPFIGGLQEKYSFLRPVLFHSPYEGAASFIIGHRISMGQGRTIRRSMSQEVGDTLNVDGETLYAFPRPQTLLATERVAGISAEKVERLHGIARAALDGKLDRAYLRSLPVEQALEELRKLSGVGPFFAQGILMRAAGLQDAVTDEDVSKQALQHAHNLPTLPNLQDVLNYAETWRPYRMWAEVLLHVWFRREMGGPQGQAAKAAPSSTGRSSASS